MFKNDLMDFAFLEAQKALSSNEIPIGAIVYDPYKKKIIAQGHNLVESCTDPTAHAEMLVIKQACKENNSKFLINLDLYVTLQPCPMCMQAIIYAKIKRLYFGAYATNKYLTFSYNNHVVEVYGGIQERRCQTLIDQFFKKKREPSSSQNIHKYKQ